MKLLIIVILIIEIIFLVLGYIYLKNSTKINGIKKIFLMFLYLIIFLLLNIIIITNILYLSFINNNDNYLQVKNTNNELNIKLNELKLKKDNLEEELNDTKYLTLKEQIDALEKEYTDIKDKITEYEKEISNNEKKLKELMIEYQALEEKSKYIIENFPTYHQFPNYPNGCESVALYLLLKYHNIDVTVEQIVEKLKKGAAPFRKNGILYGGDPEIEFVGDPRLKTGYGVYEKPIINVAEQFKEGIKNISGTSLDDVLKIVKTGKPVQVWASINLKNTYICAKWQSTSTNRIIEWKCGLHSLIVIGYTYDKIITSDPYTGKIEYYNKTQFESIYNTYGKRAIYYE